MRVKLLVSGSYSGANLRFNDLCGNNTLSSGQITDLTKLFNYEQEIALLFCITLLHNKVSAVQILLFLCQLSIIVLMWF